MNNKKTPTDVKAQQIVEMLQSANLSYTDMLEVLRLARLKLNQKLFTDVPAIRKPKNIKTLDISSNTLDFKY